MGIALYANASDAVYLYKRIGRSQESTRIYVIKAKGCFAPLHPDKPNKQEKSNNGDGKSCKCSLPKFTSDSAFWKECTEKDIRFIRKEERSNGLPGVHVGASTDVSGAPVNVAINVAQLVVAPTITQNDLDAVIKPEVMAQVTGRVT